jgi:hypothetical protein
MTNYDLIVAFINGSTKGKASNLYIEGDALVNYWTVIARRVEGVIVMNSHKYSVTTSKIQNYIRRASGNKRIEINGEYPVRHAKSIEHLVTECPEIIDDLETLANNHSQFKSIWNKVRLLGLLNVNLNEEGK